MKFQYFSVCLDGLSLNDINSLLITQNHFSLFFFCSQPLQTLVSKLPSFGRLSGFYPWPSQT